MKDYWWDVKNQIKQTNKQNHRVILFIFLIVEQYMPDHIVLHVDGILYSVEWNIGAECSFSTYSNLWWHLSFNISWSNSLAFKTLN